MMKAKDQPDIRTIPEGAYESGMTDEEIRKKKKKRNVSENIGADAQGNGYPYYKEETEYDKD